jgi:DNA polymerase-3 subunit alpha/error-prone DNA polymerase
MRRLKCDNYKILVAASSITSGWRKVVWWRVYFRHNHWTVRYFHETFKEHLGETYVMVYQRRCNKVLHFAGVPPLMECFAPRDEWQGRSVAALQKVKDNFFACCAKRTSLSTESSIRQIESFWDSFCKAHSAIMRWKLSSLYLKCITRRVYGGSYQQPRIL